MKKYRFFYHYYRQYNAMSIHFRGKCFKVNNIICNVPCQTHWQDKQPRLIMRGFATDVIIENETAFIT